MQLSGVRADGSRRTDKSQRRFWTNEETDAILSGIQEFSEDQDKWKKILNKYWDVFKINSRTTVDLKVSQIRVDREIKAQYREFTPHYKFVINIVSTHFDL